MKFIRGFIGFFVHFAAACDNFNYGETSWDERDFGPADWGEVARGVSFIFSLLRLKSDKCSL